MPNLPKVLVIDDLFGRIVSVGTNRERENLCGKFLLEDGSPLLNHSAARFKIPNPIAIAEFCRGQLPAQADIGAVVENDLQGTLETIKRGWSKALKGGEMPWSLVLLDLCFYTGHVTAASDRRTRGMPVGRSSDDESRSYFGLVLLEEIHRTFPELPVVILSSKPRDEVSLDFSRHGALGFISRDDANGPDLLEEAIWQHGLLEDPEGEIIGRSLQVLLALREARRASRHEGNLLIRGERGSGKELLASYVHRMSRGINRSSRRPFVAVNSAVLGKDLFSSELFGIEPRTASGVEGRIGLIEAADGGDLFLDEIADMSPEVQAAVLRTLQERQITKVGSRHPKGVNVRFLSATNADIEEPAQGFRADLLDRLRLGGTLWLPALRERSTDIPALAEAFVRDAEERSSALHRQITPETIAVLVAHKWPGNIRELRSCIFDAVNRHPDVEYLVPNHLRIGHARAGADLHQETRRRKPVSVLPSETPAPTALKALFEIQEETTFDPGDIGQWAGQLSAIQNSQARVLARYLDAALAATIRRTPENPQGVIQIHPAVKLITGDSSLTASNAADIIKRLLGPIAPELDGTLSLALQTAIRLRPRSRRTTPTAA